ncbi:MAG: hypothetical protein Q8859_10430, partial [Bacteroidota bacterium]|nr:hypothetical protein [Bacteroidota bacterium]
LLIPVNEYRKTKSGILLTNKNTQASCPYHLSFFASILRRCDTNLAFYKSFSYYKMPLLTKKYALKHVFEVKTSPQHTVYS